MHLYHNCGIEKQQYKPYDKSRFNSYIAYFFYLFNVIYGNVFKKILHCYSQIHILGEDRMKKRLPKFVPVLMSVSLLLCSSPGFPALADSSTTLTVDCGSSIRAATHCASGSLYGVTESKPGDITNLVAPLNPSTFTNPARAGSGYQQPSGAAIPVAKRLSSTTGKVIIRLADLFPNWPYSFSNMSNWLDQVSSVIDDKKSSGVSNFYGYEIWNEPDGTWNTRNGTFNNLWIQTYQLIRSKDPQVPIVGPSYSYYNHSQMQSFLSFCKDNNCLPDVVCWHELGSGSGAVAGHMTDFRSLESSLGISARKISINEYCDPDHAKEGCPGTSAPFIAKFERYQVDSACISWWFTAHPGRLGSLLASDTEKGGGWWFYNWYGQMSGNMVRTTPEDENSTKLDGFASVDSAGRKITVLCGGDNSGSVNVKLNNIPSFIGSTASVKVECAPWSGKDNAVSGTSVVLQNNYSVSNGRISVKFSNTNGTDGYRIIVTPGFSQITSGQTYKLENQNSSRVLGIQDASKDMGAAALQWEDNGTTDHNWIFLRQDDGSYKIKNAHSGLLLGVEDASKDMGASVLQWEDNGTADHEWLLEKVSGNTYKIKNKNSGLLLGITDMSCASGTQALQWEDNGTADHNWYLELSR